MPVNDLLFIDHRSSPAFPFANSFTDIKESPIPEDSPAFFCLMPIRSLASTTNDTTTTTTTNKNINNNNTKKKQKKKKKNNRNRCWL